jgi:hypothetical protein
MNPGRLLLKAPSGGFPEGLLTSLRLRPKSKETDKEAAFATASRL